MASYRTVFAPVDVFGGQRVTLAQLQEFIDECMDKGAAPDAPVDLKNLQVRIPDKTPDGV